MLFEDPRNVLELRSSGSFHFYYTELHHNKEILGSFYIVVNPELTVYGGKKRKEQTLSVNAIQCQTVLSKCMGPIDTWRDKLRVCEWIAIICRYTHCLVLGHYREWLQHDPLDSGE